MYFQQILSELRATCQVPKNKKDKEANLLVNMVMAAAQEH